MFLQKVSLIMDHSDSLPKEEHFNPNQPDLQLLQSCHLATFHQKRLEMFHELGVLFHFSTPAELREIVILQPQWLVSGMCQVIFDWNLHEQEHHRQIKVEMKSTYDSWRYHGIVSRRLLDRLWDFGFQAQKQFLLRFMEEVALVCEIEKDTFLVPCLLPEGQSNEKLTSPRHRFVLDFTSSFLPDSLFRRLICYAVQKSNGRHIDELQLYATHAFMSFEGHNCCIQAKLESDLIQVDLLDPTDQSTTGPWLVLHTITNLVEHLRMDFMKEIRYDVQLCHDQLRVNKLDVETAREMLDLTFQACCMQLWDRSFSLDFGSLFNIIYHAVI